MVRLKYLWIILACIWSLSEGIVVYAQEAEFQGTTIEADGFRRPENMMDQNRDTYSGSKQEATVEISREDGIGALYIEFDRIPDEWTLLNPATGESIVCGQNAFLHEYVDVFTEFGEAPQNLVMQFSEGTSVADIYGFSQGQLPDWVQVWNPPCEEADLLLLSSHSDDEQLFFAGVLPYYAIERKVNVQVAYVVQHFEANNVENHQRPHEQLDGLWKVGVKNYPIMSDFPDLYAESKNRQEAFEQASNVYEAAGITYDDFVGYITGCLRRCKPLVVVSHDLNGEYGHGTHVLCSAALTEAIGYAADAAAFPESAEKYGVWKVEKTYLHLYEENPIVMDFDAPLDSMGGKSAFQVSQEGFGCHKSQHWTWFYKWMYGTSEKPIKQATDIRKYSPCHYGLYDSIVGLDSAGGDFLENIKTYEERALEAEMKRLEEEATKAAEEEKKAKEEAERLEQQKALEELKQTEAVEEAVVIGEKAEAGGSIMIGILVCLAFVVSAALFFLKKYRSNMK